MPVLIDDPRKEFSREFYFRSGWTDVTNLQVIVANVDKVRSALEESGVTPVGNVVDLNGQPDKTVFKVLDRLEVIDPYGYSVEMSLVRVRPSQTLE